MAATEQLVGLTGFNVDMPDGNSMFLSELAGLQSVGVMSPPGSTDGEAAALLERLGFNGSSAEFNIPQGDPLPPDAWVPEPGTLSLVGLGVLMLGVRVARLPRAALFGRWPSGASLFLYERYGGDDTSHCLCRGFGDLLGRGPRIERWPH